NTVLTTNAQGKIKISGLDSDTYYLREIKAPAGYNALGQDVEVKITGATTKEDGSDSLTYTTVVAEINNQSGTELPSTGGMGTTVFYILGSVLVLGAAVVLVTRKRMKEHN
ncbi:MAG: SpaA isopeptide-forming pilin-related protein, partial [Clostridiales bacterium]|nr:SpaA isopeptide-forming pilin-related protein [Clostridiales bacterium]